GYRACGREAGVLRVVAHLGLLEGKGGRRYVSRGSGGGASDSRRQTRARVRLRGAGAYGSTPGQDGQRDEEAECEERCGPFEGGRVAVYRCRTRDTGGRAVRGGVAGGGTGEDRAQQGGADRAADLL